MGAAARLCAAFKSRPRFAKGPNNKPQPTKQKRWMQSGCRHRCLPYAFRSSFITVGLVLPWLGLILVTFLEKEASEVDMRMSSTSQSLSLYRPSQVSRYSCRSRIKNVADLYACYPRERITHLVRPNCTVVNKWADVQRCLMGYHNHASGPETFRAARVTPITEIHILGERNSGTKFIQREIQKCFPRTHGTIRAHRDFLRAKHFFQPVGEEVLGSGRGRNYTSSLVVVVVRDPVEWMAAMRQYPYHAPAHVAAFVSATNGSRTRGRNASVVGPDDSSESSSGVLPLDWPDFVSRPWTTTRSQHDQRLWSYVRDTGNKTLLYHARDICREQFTFYEIVPCRYDEVTLPPSSHPWMTNSSVQEHGLHYGGGKVVMVPKERLRGYEPIYELRRDRSGRPYDHLLQLRADKLVNFVLEVPLLLRLGGFLVLRYEDVLERGSTYFLQQIADILLQSGASSSSLTMFSTSPSSWPCQPALPQPERIGHRDVPAPWVEWIEANMDAEVERLVGYPFS